MKKFLIVSEVEVREMKDLDSFYLTKELFKALDKEFMIFEIDDKQEKLWSMLGVCNGR